MIFDPTDFDAPTARATNWFGRMMGRAAAAHRTSRLTSVSDLPPRLLDDIGISRALVDVTLRHRR